MPFEKNNSAFTFTEQGIAKYAPRNSGVYGIRNAYQWIYIGESKDMEGRLYEHLRGESDQSARILKHNPTLYSFEECDAKTRTARETELIAELNPLEN
jgi:predicted GIY-YIG superfamily endonuclease